MGLIPALAKSSKLRGMPSVAFAVSNKNSLKLPLVTGETRMLHQKFEHAWESRYTCFVNKLQSWVHTLMHFSKARNKHSIRRSAVA